MAKSRRKSSWNTPIPREVSIQCYRGCGNWATMGKIMKTPSGGEYWRGICSNDIDCREPQRDWETAAGGGHIITNSKFENRYKIKIGEPLQIKFDAELMRVLPKNKVGVYLGREEYILPDSLVFLNGESLAKRRLEVAKEREEENKP